VRQREVKYQSPNILRVRQAAVRGRDGDRFQIIRATCLECSRVAGVMDAPSKWIRMRSPPFRAFAVCI
jgi:hypothetical protein